MPTDENKKIEFKIAISVLSDASQNYLKNSLSQNETEVTDEIDLKDREQLIKKLTDGQQVTAEEILNRLINLEIKHKVLFSKKYGIAKDNDEATRFCYGFTTVQMWVFGAAFLIAAALSGGAAAPLAVLGFAILLGSLVPCVYSVSGDHDDQHVVRESENKVNEVQGTLETLEKASQLISGKTTPEVILYFEQKTSAANDEPKVKYLCFFSDISKKEKVSQVCKNEDALEMTEKDSSKALAL